MAENPEPPHPRTDTPNVRELYVEYRTADAEIVQKLTKQAWGGTDFIVGDPDGNAIAFVG